MKLYYLILYFILQLCIHLSFAANPANSHYEEDAATMKKCLTDENGKIAKIDLQRVSTFSQWNETEEVICFTYCLSTNKGWFDVSSGRWIRQQLENDLGANLYKYCEYELDRSYENVCDFVFKGFQCLRQATNNTVESYKAFINCAIELHTNLDELMIYANFPVQEHVPCMFKCFAEKFLLYNQNYEWNTENWIRAFGTIKGVMQDYSVCRASAAEKALEQNKCEWMYKEYRCLERLSKSGADAALETEGDLFTTTVDEETSEDVTNYITEIDEISESTIEN